MLKLLRVDDRLLHGQVAFLWTKYLAIQSILIANDNAAHDEFMKMTLGMAKPIGVELQIIEVSQAVKVLKENKESRQSMMVVVNTLEDAERLIHETGFIHSLNLGGLRERPNTTRISHSITLNEEDKEICRRLILEGIEIEIRMVPENKKIMVGKMI